MEEFSINIINSSDVGEAERLFGKIAGEIGFEEKESQRIKLAVRELGTNLVKHAGYGKLNFSEIKNGQNSGIQIVSTDRGPGISNVEQTFEDGYTTSGGLGYGMGTINRIMDEVDIKTEVNEETGTNIICKRWSGGEKNKSGNSFLSFGVASRPHPDMNKNGDAFLIKQWQTGAFVAIVDGLGHGKNAFKASKRVINYLEEHYQQSYDDLIKGLNRTCRSTRGVVLGMMKFDTIQKSIKFTGIGNISVKTHGFSESVHFISKRGIIGGNVENPLIKECSFESDFAIVLFTDGIESRWDIQDHNLLKDQPPFQTAKSLLNKLSKNDDDSTVLVIKG